MSIPDELQMLVEGLNSRMTLVTPSPQTMFDENGQRRVGHFFFKEDLGRFQLCQVESQYMDLMVSAYWMDATTMSNFIRGIWAGYSIRFKMDQELGFIPR